MAPVSKAHIAATKRYEDKAYDKFLIRVPKGRKDVIQTASSAVGESLNGYVSKAIDERLERESVSGTVTHERSRS